MITLMRHALALLCTLMALLSALAVWIAWGTYQSPLGVMFYGSILIFSASVAIDMEWPDGD